MAGTVTSETDICNQALSKLGVEPIVSLTENTKAAKRCKLVFDALRDEVQESHYWNFCIRRVTLAALVDPPLFDFDFQYQLPPDVLRVIRLQDKTLPFKVEADNLLLTDLSDAKCMYVGRVTDVSKFSPTFVSAFVYLITSDLAYNLIQDKNLAAQMQNRYLAKLKDARTFDGQEGFIDQIDSDEFLAVRVSGGGLFRDVEV